MQKNVHKLLGYKFYKKKNKSGGPAYSPLNSVLTPFKKKNNNNKKKVNK